MNRILCTLSFILCPFVLSSALAQPEPVFLETFDRCIDAEDEHYGFTGGNDNQWGGDIATAQTIYEDSPEWNLSYCNGGYQCLKVGTSTKQGSATTPAIACQGDAVLTFRVAPWEGDSLFYITLSGGTTTDPTAFHLKKHRWTDLTVHITDITGSLRIKFTSQNKHRFFLDDVCVRPADPDAGAIRTGGRNTLDFGLLGRHYSAQTQELTVTGCNLSADGITASLADGETSLFTLNTTSLPAEGGTLSVTLKTGATADMHGCYLYLRGKDKTTRAAVEKRITVVCEVATLSLEGSGTKPDPYTCGDVILLANNEGTAWTKTFYWVKGYVLGGVKRYQDAYDGISLTDNLSLVLAAKPDETDDNRYVTVQISHDARAALNVVDNPELIGQQILVQGLLLNDNANPLYLGKPGVRGVSTNSQYVRPDKTTTIEHTPFPSKEGRGEASKLIKNGQLFIQRNGRTYTATGAEVK